MALLDKTLELYSLYQWVPLRDCGKGKAKKDAWNWNRHKETCRDEAMKAYLARAEELRKKLGA